MCVVSMIQEHYTEKWKPQQWPFTSTGGGVGQGGTIVIQAPAPSPEEIAEFRKLLERAREYDKKNSEPDCELETKKTTLRELAKYWGIDISFIDKETE